MKVDEDVVPPPPLGLDDSDVGDHEFFFMQGGEDGTSGTTIISLKC
jgi:hypothetical protein